MIRSSKIFSCSSACRNICGTHRTTLLPTNNSQCWSVCQCAPSSHIKEQEVRTHIISSQQASLLKSLTQASHPRQINLLTACGCGTCLDIFYTDVALCIIWHTCVENFLFWPAQHYIGTAVPLLVATLSRGLALPNVGNFFCCCRYRCIYFSLSPKATSLMWPQFLAKKGGLIRQGSLYIYKHIGFDRFKTL